MNAKKVLNIFSSLVTAILFLLLIFMVFVVISAKASGGEPQFLGYQLKTVLSGSMEPTFKTGSIIAVKPVKDPNQLKKDDIITFMETQDKLVTHRIIEVMDKGEQTMFKTKGDNNEDPDMNAVVAQNVVAKYTGFTIPLAGYFIDFAKSKNGIALLLILPGLLLLTYSGVTIFRALKEIESPKKQNDVQETI
ncbi:signal peptidase I SipW [Mesobacillus selenatarsenatis]|uniref:Signal peptidase I n=1 Tax=Mesobacillus selenatarsenatis TaxID=388741 RepID=A0A846U0U1_9BACI|nr:signal peptidase I [Mesobacillus selenatarsenatis]NKE07456.1 signal peptidase I [Mesobacillus selenatarsenatis]